MPEGSPRTALAVVLIGALASGVSAPPVAAQTAAPAAPVHVQPRLDPHQRAEVETALRAMPADLLYLTHARIHAAFRAQIGQDDLRLARALVDRALLTEAELRSRALPVPEGSGSAAQMLTLYELVL